MQHCSNSIANAMDLLYSCTEVLITSTKEVFVINSIGLFVCPFLACLHITKEWINRCWWNLLDESQKIQENNL